MTYTFNIFFLLKLILDKFKKFCLSKFEGQYKYFFLNPFEVNYSNIKKIIQKIDTTIGNTSIYAHETILYAEDNININSFLKLNAGLHYSTFIVEGKFALEI